MIKKALYIIAVFMMVPVISAPAAPINLSQAKLCLPIEAINGLVKDNKIRSFNKITRDVGDKNAKIFNQRLCQVDGQYVYFFKIVDPRGKARGMALDAVTGKPFPPKG
jgi:hypothetical protein